MRLTLVKPNIGRMEHSLYVDEGRMEPLNIGVLAGLTPPGVDVAFHDDRCEPIPYDEPTDLVAITVETFTARRSYEIAAEFRARGVPVVLGGVHPSLLPEEASAHADAIVCGDAEGVWAQVLEDARHRRLQPVYRGRSGPPQAGTFARRDIFQGKGYLPVSLVQYGRGCRNACTYCTISAYFQRSYTYRPVDEVVREVEALGRRLVFFVDDNIVADHAAAKALFRALIPLRIRWVGQGSIDMTGDPELMALMAESGCLGNVIGFESIDPAALRALKKGPNIGRAGSDESEPYEREVAVLRAHGLQTWAAFLLGADQDTVEGLQAQLRFATRHRFTFAAFNILMPYPNTPLYRELEAQGRLLYGGRWWLHPEYRFNHAAFRPARMSPDDLTRAAFENRARWNSIGSILWRFSDIATNMRTLARMRLFWSYVPLFRRETFKKQGMRFGLEAGGAAPCESGLRRGVA